MYRLRVGGLGHIGLGWIRARHGVRVIEAENVEPLLAGRLDGAEMIVGINLESPRALRDVRGAHAVMHVARGPDQQTAALARHRLTGVRDHFVENVLRDGHVIATDAGTAATEQPRIARVLQSRSTAIAIPMPPPMHSAATP